MVDERELRQALRAKLNNVTGLPSFLADENRDFDPPAPTQGAIWVHEYLIPLDESIISSGYIQSLGIVQYTVYVPKESGTEAAEDLATAIAAEFAPTGSGVTVDGNTVHLYKTQRLPAEVSPEFPAWRAKPVHVYWRAFTPSN